MSTIQRLTLMGMNNYIPDLFEKLVLPEGYDKQTFIDSLLLEHGEKCVLYSNPLFMRDAIGAWSKKWELELERILQALKAEYDPIYNYDRYEEYTDNEKRTLDNVSGAIHNATDNIDHSDTLTNNLKDKQTNDYKTVSETNDEATTEHLVSADNSGSYQPSSKDISDGGKSTERNDGTITHDNTGTAKHEYSGKVQDLSETSSSRSNDDEKREFVHKAHLFGNIGVTTSASMVSEVIRQRMSTNLYEIATRLFANELLIGIY